MRLFPSEFCCADSIVSFTLGELLRSHKFRNLFRRFERKTSKKLRKSRFACLPGNCGEGSECETNSVIFFLLQLARVIKPRATPLKQKGKGQAFREADIWGFSKSTVFFPLLLEKGCMRRCKYIALTFGESKASCNCQLLSSLVSAHSAVADEDPKVVRPQVFVSLLWCSGSDKPRRVDTKRVSKPVCGAFKQGQRVALLFTFQRISLAQCIAAISSWQCEGGLVFSVSFLCCLLFPRYCHNFIFVFFLFFVSSSSSSLFFLFLFLLRPFLSFFLLPVR